MLSMFVEREVWRCGLTEFVAAVVLAIVAPADAGPMILISRLITETLSGNTLVGEWDGASYRQYFDPSGQTIYATKGGKPVVGSWHVNDVDQLCETVPLGTQERCYGILRAGITIFWVTSNSGLRHRADIVSGKALDFSAESQN